MKEEDQLSDLTWSHAFLFRGVVEESMKRRLLELLEASIVEAWES